MKLFVTSLILFFGLTLNAFERSLGEDADEWMTNGAAVELRDALDSVKSPEELNQCREACVAEFMPGWELKQCLSQCK